MKRRATLLAALAVGAISAVTGRATAQSVGAVTVTNETPTIARMGEIARGGISFAPDNAPTDPAHLHFKLNGVEISAQVHQLGRGNTNGTLRHALVQLPVDLAASGASQRFDFYIDPLHARPTPNHSVTVTTTGPTASPTSVTVVTGGLEVRLDAACFHLPNRLKLNGVTIVDNTAACSTGSTVDPTDDVFLTGRIETPVAGVTDVGMGRATEPGGVSGAGSLSPAATAAAQDFSAQLRGAVELTVEESGPLRAVVLVRQPSTVRTQNGRFGFVARLYFEAGRPAFRVSYSLVYQAEPVCFTTGCASPNFVAVPVAHVEDLTYRLGPTGVTSSTVAADAQSMPTAAVNVNAMPAAGTGWDARYLPGQAPNLDAGWASLQGASWRMVLANRAFEGVGPKRVEIVSNRVHNRLLLRQTCTSPDPQTCALQQTRLEQQLALFGGHTRTWEFVVDFSSPLATETVTNAGRRVRALASRPLVAAHLPCDAATREGSFRFAAEVIAPSCSSTRAPLPALATYHARSRLYEDGGAPFTGRVFGWFAGDRDLGANTAQGTMSTAQSGQYGPAHAVLMRYRASGHLPDLRKAEDMVRFALNTSLVAWAATGTDVRLRRYVPAGREPLTLAATMHSGQIVMGNNYLAYNDVANYYFLTGDRRVVDILREVARWPAVAQGNEMPVAGQFGREFYAPFAAFLDAWEVLGDNRMACSARAMSCPGAEPPSRPVGGELLDTDSINLFKTIKAMRDLASGVPVPERSALQVAMLDANAITARVPDRVAPDGQNPVYEYTPLCPSGLRSQTSTVSDACIPMNTPGLVGTNAAGSYPDLTPFFVTFGARALSGYHALTGDSATRDALAATVRIQHLFINPFGLFQAKALAPLHDRFMNQEDFVSASAGHFATVDGPSSSEALTRLTEAAPSVDYRLTFRRRYTNSQRFGMDADLYPFLAAWIDRGYSETSLRTTAQYAVWQRIDEYENSHPTYHSPTNGQPSVHQDDYALDTFDPEPTPNPFSIFWDIYFRTPESERLNTNRGIAWADLFGATMYARSRLALTSEEGVVNTTNHKIDNCAAHHTPQTPSQLLGLIPPPAGQPPWSMMTTQGPFSVTATRGAMMYYSASHSAAPASCSAAGVPPSPTTEVFY
jgi:hypothetical protein